MTRRLLSFFQEFREHPFEALDNLDLSYFGFQFNVLRNDEKLRNAIFQIFFLVPLIAWLLLGPDSTVDQFTNLLVMIPNTLLGRMTVPGLLQFYNSYYGLGTHWSASVIYSAMLIGLSKHLHDKLDIKNSLNLSLTCGFVGISIATFEFFWQASYAYFQNQWWVLYLQFPQLRIIMQNTLFAFVGILVLLSINWQKYKLNINWQTILFAAATIGIIFFWWNYPFSTQQLTVGIWTSSPHFPQTMYTIQPRSDVAYGFLYHIEDAGVHLTNNLAKILMTLTFYSLFKIKTR